MAIRILIAEDHGVVRDGTKRILAEQGDFEVVAEADTGEEAVELGRKTQPDVAVVDIHLPGIHGIEVIRQLQSVSPDTRVLILSAHSDDDYVGAAMEAGALGYLLKTARAEELVKAVRTVVKGDVALHPEIERKIVRLWVQRGAGEATDGEEADSLTPREMDVLKLVAQGFRNKEVADHLSVSIRTVEGHLNNIYSKLGVSSRTEAVIYGVNQNWFSLPELLEKDKAH